MSLTFSFEPSVTPELRDGILDLWADVTNAGGAVGFVPPVTREAIRPELVKHFAAMAEGRTRLLVGHDEDGRVAATAFLTHNTHRLMTHWVWLYTVMVHPRHQGRGHRAVFTKHDVVSGDRCARRHEVEIDAGLAQAPARRGRDRLHQLARADQQELHGAGRLGEERR